MRTHPFVFLVLIVPFGAMAGYLTVALEYQLSQAGISVAAVGALVALSYVPHTWKFLWAPIVDTTLTRKKWYLIAAAFSAVGIFSYGLVPTTAAYLPLLTLLVVISNFAATVLAMGVESLMAYNTAENQKGRAAGWFQAGNLGGQGLGGGAGLWLAQNLPDPWMAAAIVAIACALCALALLFIADPGHTARVEGRGIGETMLDVLRDLWRVARSRMGFLALLICFLPIGTGAASNLWSAVADEWHASANSVALVNGTLGGVVSIVGCLVGGYLCDRIDRKFAYALYGIVQALCAVAMAIAPRSETMYIAFTLLYAFSTGLCYASFSAVVLEAIGKGAAATKYSLFASLSNMPIAYMTYVDGVAHERVSSAGMLYTEAGVCVIATAAFFAIALALRRRAPVEPEASARP
jgi:MFS family permease